MAARSSRFHPAAASRCAGPAGGIGGDTHGALDWYDPTSARQTFAHCDARFIRWLEGCGHVPDYCTDLTCTTTLRDLVVIACS